VNRGLSPWIKGFSKDFIDGGARLFTLRLARVSHSKTGSFDFETPA